MVANGVGRVIISLESAIAQLNIQNEKEKEEFLDYLASNFTSKLKQTYKTWSLNRTVRERKNEQDRRVTKPPDSEPTDRLQKHKAEFKAEQEARKNFG